MNMNRHSLLLVSFQRLVRTHPLRCCLLFIVLVTLSFSVHSYAATYSVPATIPSDCSSDSSSALNTWFATVPDNSTIEFPANACYGLSHSLLFNNRNGLSIIGNGSEIKLLTTATSQMAASKTSGFLSVWVVNGGSNISFSGLSLVGDNGATSVNGQNTVCNPDGILEWQFGINFNGTNTGNVTNVDVSHTCGDFIEAQPYCSGTYSQASGCNDTVFTHPATHITITGGSFMYAGRQGIGLSDVSGATISGITMNHVAQAAIDVETDTAQEVANNISITSSSFNDIEDEVLSNFGAGGAPNVGNITVTGNTQTGTLSCNPLIWGDTPAGSTTRRGYTISGNHFAPYVELASFQSVDNLSITNNVDSGAQGNQGCGGDGLLVSAVKGATIEDNDFGPTVTTIAKLSAITDLVYCGNKDETTSSFTLPMACTAASTKPITIAATASTTKKHHYRRDALRAMGLLVVLVILIVLYKSLKPRKTPPVDNATPPYDETPDDHVPPPDV